MTYEKLLTIALRGLKAFKKSAKQFSNYQFRRATVYESSGLDGNLIHALFGFEICDEHGENYHEITISATPENWVVIGVKRI